MNAVWREAQHPRDPDGRFTDKTSWVHRLLGKGGGRDLRGELDYGDLKRQLDEWNTAGTSSVLMQVDDPALSSIYEAQGYHAKPRVVSRNEMDQLVRSGWTEAWRGIADFDTEYAGDLAERFRTGERHFAGEGVHGNGTYTTDTRSTAETYAGEDRAGLLRIAIPPSARLINRSEAGDLRHEYIQNRKDPAMRFVFNDLGRFLAAAGYDGMVVNRRDGQTYHVLFNRGILAVQEVQQ